MKLSEIIKAIDAEVTTGQALIEGKVVKGGYVSDLLSDVMGHAQEGAIWLTIQTHPNVVAVALLLNLSAVVFTAGQKPEETTVEKAKEEGIVLLTTALSTYEAAGRLYAILN
jgi:predicted transcriptional regulator